MNPETEPKVVHSSTWHSVPLDKPPSPFVIPADLQARFRYDSGTQRLAFEGYMCKRTFDRLREISPDFAYQRALEDLFRIALPEERSRPNRGHHLLVAAVVLALALAAVCGVAIWRW